MSTACTLGVISVDSSSLESIDGIFNKSALVKSVGVDSRLNVIHIRNSKCVVDNVRGRAPVLVYLQAYTACLYLLLKSCDVA